MIAELQPFRERLRAHGLPEQAVAEATELALDRLWRSSFAADLDGDVLHLKNVPLTRVGVSLRSGDQIRREAPSISIARHLIEPRDYLILKPAGVLQKAAAGFSGAPIVAGHDQRDVIGELQGVYFSNPFLFGDAVIHDPEAIDAFFDGTRCAPSIGGRVLRFEMQPGLHEGQPFDGYIADLTLDHLAIVEHGISGIELPLSHRLAA